MLNGLLAQLASSYCNYQGPRSAPDTGGGPIRKRRLEEILDFDLEYGVLDRQLKSKMFRPDMYQSRSDYMQRQMNQGELSMPNTTLGHRLLGLQKSGHLVSIPSLSVPAFGMDPVDEIGGKFDLVMNTMTSLYNKHSPPLEHNKLLFHYVGLAQSPYAHGENQAPCDALGAMMSMDTRRSRTDVETDVNTRRNVDEAFRLLLNGNEVNPVATLIPFDFLQKHIKDSNRKLECEYGTHMRNGQYSDLKSEVIRKSGCDSVVALMVHMESPEMFYNTFFPRGICSSTCTGRMLPSRSGKFVVTLQTMGTLHVDVEDGDAHLRQGVSLDMAYLYLIIEMKQLVPLDDNFNFPWIRMLLTSKTVDQLEIDMLTEAEGMPVRSKTGQSVRSIIKPIARLRNGPYHVRHEDDRDARQHYQFDLMMESLSGGLRLVTLPGT